MNDGNAVVCRWCDLNEYGAACTCGRQCAGRVKTSKALEELVPLIQEAVKAAAERGDTVRLEDIRPPPEVVEMWKRAERLPSPAEAAIYGRGGHVPLPPRPVQPLMPPLTGTSTCKTGCLLVAGHVGAGEQCILDPSGLRHHAVSPFETMAVATTDVRHGAIAGTPATMLGEAVVHIARARQLVKAACRPHDDLASRADSDLEEAGQRVDGLKREAEARDTSGKVG